MRKIMQFRYEGYENENNYPEYSDYNSVLKNNLLKDFPSVSHLGIQGPQGLRFYLNGGENPITIGKTGIYELDLDGIGRINKLCFNETDISSYFGQESTNRLLVDIIYEGGSTV